MTAKRYSVCAYINGQPYKFTTVIATSREEAVKKGWEKFRKMGIEPQTVTAN